MTKTTKKDDSKALTKENKLVWRLGTLPSVTELTELVDKNLITKAEAREIMFKKENVKEIPTEGEVTRYVTKHYTYPDIEVIDRFIKDFFRPFWRI